MVEMIYVENGTFLMGSNTTEENESPEHTVFVNSFYIGKSAITQNEWKHVMGKINAYNKGDNYPVEQITWIEALAFCNKLSILENLSSCYQKDDNYITWNIEANGYRLPTEAEWEYAASGGNQSRHYLYSGSNNPKEVAWYKDNSDKHTHEVCTLGPNELGIFDMSGNIYEICWDEFRDYKKEEQNNPNSGLRSKDAERHILRGGNCHGFANRCRITSRRNGLYKGFRQDFVGFRIAKNAQ